ncbi:MAG TPA: protein kinase [Polyangiaceae bacterium]|nr:protein kinase [Polyangiaceae bacterium]
MNTRIAPGTILSGKYRVEGVLGSGGMGMVLAAHHLQLDERVAIKVLLPSMLENSEATARFAREARAAVKIKSEYVARVIDVGTLDSGHPYMVMEYLEGEDLADMLSRGRLPREQAVELVLQACEALGEAHALGIIHRDIKPANLYCVRRTDGLLAVKLLDFGISRASGGTELALTSSGMVMGSPQYMAPEQMLAAKNADLRSDLWSLGAVLFELLVGEPPVAGETFAELVVQVTTLDPTKLALRMQKLPPRLAQATLRCLNVDPVHRYQSVGELASALVPFGPIGRAQAHADRVLRIARSSQHPESAPPAAATTDSPGYAARAGKSLMPVGHTSIDALALGKPRSRWARLAAGSLALLTIGAGWWGLAHRRTTDPRGDVSTDATLSHAATGQQDAARPSRVPTDPRANPDARSEVAQPIARPSARPAASEPPAPPSTEKHSTQPEPQLADHAPKAGRQAKPKKGSTSTLSGPTPVSTGPAAGASSQTMIATDADNHDLGGRL